MCSTSLFVHFYCPPGRSGGHFSPHIDGPWVPHEDESSVFTVVVYLNADFEGGATNFISEDSVGKEWCYHNYACVLDT